MSNTYEKARAEAATAKKVEQLIQDHNQRTFMEELETDRKRNACRNATALYDRYRAYLKKPGFKGEKELEAELHKIAVEKCSKK